MENKSFNERTAEELADKLFDASKMLQYYRDKYTEEYSLEYYYIRTLEDDIAGYSGEAHFLSKRFSLLERPKKTFLQKLFRK